MIEKLISGGQTGVDRAALDVALELNIPTGGWCPKNRHAEDGKLSAKYPLLETESEDYPQRTEWNVRDSDGTLILSCSELTGGTAATREFATRLNKPYLIIDLTDNDIEQIKSWIESEKIKTLNVAGPRESTSPGIYQKASTLMKSLLQRT